MTGNARHFRIVERTDAHLIVGSEKPERGADARQVVAQCRHAQTPDGTSPPSSPARTPVPTICYGPNALGAAGRLTRRASFATFCSHLPSLGAGRTSDPTRWNPDGWRRRWGALQRRAIFVRGLQRRPGSPRAKTRWHDRQADISIISAFVHRTRSQATSGLRRRY